MIDNTRPLLPLRPQRPARCIYSFGSSGKFTLITTSILSICKPLAAISVAKRS